MSALTTHTYSNPREKEKKRKEQKKLQQAIESQRKAKDHLKKTSLGPLREGQYLDTSETKHAQAKSTNHQSKARKPQRAPPCTHASSPWTNATPPGRIHVNHFMKKRSYNSSALTGQTGQPHRLDRWARSPSTWELHRSNWCPSPVRSMAPGKLPELKNSSKPLGNLLNACSKPIQA
jgi:hypothetical protein